MSVSRVFVNKHSIAGAEPSMHDNGSILTIRCTTAVMKAMGNAVKGWAIHCLKW
jgi:hypothetical protein